MAKCLLPKILTKLIFSINTSTQYSYFLPTFDHLPQKTVSIDSIDITEEVTHKATGTDGINPAIFKHCAIVLTKPLHYLFLQSIQHYSLPAEWQIHCITPILGNKNSVTNYM